MSRSKYFRTQISLPPDPYCFINIYRIFFTNHIRAPNSCARTQRGGTPALAIPAPERSSARDPCAGNIRRRHVRPRNLCPGVPGAGALPSQQFAAIHTPPAQSVLCVSKKKKGGEIPTRRKPQTPTVFLILKTRYLQTLSRNMRWPGSDATILDF